jgi:hypothetical protein
MPNVITFEDAMMKAADRDCSLLLGNGFSARYFSYPTLLEKAGLQGDDPVRILFDRLETRDFERAVKALENASTVETAYGTTSMLRNFSPTQIEFTRP